MNLAGGTATDWLKPTWFLIATGATVPYIWRIPLVVGTFLTLMNQWRSFGNGVDTGIVLAVAINYLTPYVVSSLGFMSYKRIETLAPAGLDQ